MMLKTKEEKFGIEKDKLMNRIDQLEEITKASINSIKNVPGLVIISEQELSKTFSELRQRAKNIRTEEEKKKFFEHYSLVAKMCQSYIEAANDWNLIKYAGLEAISFYTGVDEKSSKLENLVNSGLLVLGLNPIKRMKDFIKATDIDKLKKLEKIAPNTAKVLIRLRDKIIENEKLMEKIEKEKNFLRLLSARVGKQYLGLKNPNEIKQYFSKPGIYIYFRNCSDPNQRKRFILENIMDKEFLKIKSDDPIDIKRKKEFLIGLMHYNRPPYTMEKLINDYVKAGGNEKEIVELINEVRLRVIAAGKGSGYLYFKYDSKFYHELNHDFKNIFSTLEMLEDQTLNALKRK